MKKHLIAVLLTACLLFSFGTTAFADPSGGQESNTDGANISVTKDGETEYEVTYKYITDNNTEESVKVKANAGAEYVINQSPAPRKDYIFTTWKGKVNGKEKTYKNGDKIKINGNIELVAQWEEKKGHFGYYLSDSNAHWVNMPADVIEYKDKGKTKYSEINAVAHGDTTNVTSEIPELEGHVFLGWGDKERTGTGPDQKPKICKGGNTVTYYYENGEYYTLDALWGSLTANGDTKVYDGERFELKPAVLTLNDNGLSEKLSEQYYSQLTKGSIEYSTNNTDENSWTTDLNTISFTDVGTHTLYVRQEITDGTNHSRKLTAQATYIITPRNVTLTSGSATKEYDGTALTNNTVTAEGFVNGEGATYNVTGTQTEVGSSENKFTYTLNSDTKPGNYNIATKYGTLTVTEKTTPDPVDPKSNPDTTPTPTPAPIVTPAPTAAPSTDDTTPENTATPAPTATAAPTATPAPAPTAAPAAARAATTIPQTGDNFPAVALVIVMLAAIVGLGITVVLRTDKKK